MKRWRYTGFWAEVRMRCGVDEAGRGCWAGPVVAAAVVFRERPLPGLADSKALSAKQREALYPAILEQAWVGIGMASAAEIDRVNILQATFLAMRRAVAALPALALTDIVVDGNRDPQLPGLPALCLVRTLVKADALVAEVSAASIVAKVTRDRLLAELDLAHPGYGFARHAGYGVPQHQAALAQLGPCPEHRMTFAPLKRLAGITPHDGN
jgi:ribonuclease HII